MSYIFLVFIELSLFWGFIKLIFIYFPTWRLTSFKYRPHHFSNNFFFFSSGTSLKLTSKGRPLRECSSVINFVGYSFIRLNHIDGFRFDLLYTGKGKLGKINTRIWIFQVVYIGHSIPFSSRDTSNFFLSLLVFPISLYITLHRKKKNSDYVRLFPFSKLRVTSNPKLILRSR